MIDIVEKLDQETAKRIKQYPHPNNRASEAGHPCVRFLVLSRLHPEKKALHDVGLQRIFDEGNLHEKAVLREIEEAGLHIVEQQRPFEWKKFKLSGRIDAKIAVNGAYIPLEIKSCSPNIFPHIKGLKPEELITSKYSWVRNYPAQIQSYMLMDGKEEGIILFKNKTTGEKCQKNFKLDLEYTESILKKLEIVNTYVDNEDIPGVEMIDECKRCGFAKTMCFPGQDYGPGFDLISDDELESKLIRRQELKSLAKEYEELDKEVKEHLKGKNVIVGEFIIESKEFERKNYKVPAEIKEQYLEISTYFKTSIEKLGAEESDNA